MPRLSKLVAKLEERAERLVGRWLKRHKGDLKLYTVLGLAAWYFYGMLINSIRLGIRQTFSLGNAAQSIWVVNPFRNFAAVFMPTGLAATAVCVLLICLITKKGYNRFSGYHFVHDKRGFDILPDGTHGTANFMSLREMKEFLEVGRADDVAGTIYGKYKEHPADSDEYADYIASDKQNGLNGNILVVGAPGTGKSRGVVRPFILKCVRRRESIILTDPKAELFESMAGYLEDQGYEVRVFNLLDMEYSDSWNCIGDADHDPTLMQTVAATIIANTSNEKESNDFWSKGELNLLMALLYYVQSLKDDMGKPLPLEKRSLGAIFRLLSTMPIAALDREMQRLPPGHPARAPYGLFLQAKENIRGNIAIGLGNRLSILQNEWVDRLTSSSTIELTLPGQKPCAYFCILSAQNSAYTFLSSLFFSMLFLRLEDYARRHGDHGQLPVPVNFCLDEFPNIGKLNDFRRTLSVVRGYRMQCQVYAQSVSQIADMYLRHEWEEIVGCCDATVYLGGNDQMTADFISKKCGFTTIRVTNNQMPLTPLFSPVYTSTRPYSQTRSNTQRALMLPDEVLRLDNAQCLVMLRGKQPMLLYKITPEELADGSKLRPMSISNYRAKHVKTENAKASNDSTVPSPAAAPASVRPKSETKPEPSADAPTLKNQPSTSGFVSMSAAALERLNHPPLFDEELNHREGVADLARRNDLPSENKEETIK